MAAEQKLQEHTSSWEDQKKARASESKKLEARCADLVNQNSTLHSQLEKVGLTAIFTVICITTIFQLKRMTVKTVQVAISQVISRQNDK